MNLRSLAFLAIRILSVYFFVHGITVLFMTGLVNIPQMLTFSDSYNMMWHSIAIFLPVLILFGVSALLWLFSKKLSALMIPQEESVTAPDIDFDQLQIASFTIVGVIVLVVTIPSFIREIAQIMIMNQSIMPEMTYNTSVVYPLIGSGLKMVLALLLIFQAKGLLGLIKQVRVIGTSKKE